MFLHCDNVLPTVKSSYGREDAEILQIWENNIRAYERDEPSDRPFSVFAVIA